MTTSPQAPAPPKADARANRFDTYMAVVRQACSTPAGRAALRDGLADDFRHRWPLYRHLLRHGQIPSAPDRDNELPYLLVASLYALHDAPNPTTTNRPDKQPRPSRPWRNLGWSYRTAVDRHLLASDHAESDLNSLAQLTLTSLYRALPGVVGQLRAQHVPVEWPVLLRDLTRWQRHGDEVRIAWARAFYNQDPRPTPTRW
ncbi:type I-E CRISPR-associated protein Cse2/CasB [Kitasatospora sp. NPDC101235]|uniref:type I-E CRISPR-associated protein Cse2/CasB n=1 Tax=Kitasatospora sp. NPDC101235 TaxID=3364101 RepID=UPI00380477CD